VYAPS